MGRTGRAGCAGMQPLVSLRPSLLTQYRTAPRDQDCTPDERNNVVQEHRHEGGRRGRLGWSLRSRAEDEDHMQWDARSDVLRHVQVVRGEVRQEVSIGYYGSDRKSGSFHSLRSLHSAVALGSIREAVSFLWASTSESTNRYLF